MMKLTLVTPGNTKEGSITVPLTSSLTGFDQSVLQIKTNIVSCHTANSKPVKQEVNGTVIIIPLVFPSRTTRQRKRGRFTRLMSRIGKKNCFQLISNDDEDSNASHSRSESVPNPHAASESLNAVQQNSSTNGNLGQTP